MSGGRVTLDLILCDLPVDWNSLFIGTLLSCITTSLCIHLTLLHPSTIFPPA